MALKFIETVVDLFKGAKEEPFRESAGLTVDADDHMYRKLTGDTKRDLSPIAQDRSFSLAAYLWMTNPIANRMVELPVAYILGEGVTLEVEDEEAQGWINDFWNDPINCMDLKLQKKVRELALFGEQCWPVFVNKITGHCRLGYLDPSDIETVVTDPENAEQPIGIVMKRNKRHVKRRFRIIVNGPEDVFAPGTQQIRETFTDGDCFYFKVNDLSNQARGHSDLLPMMDWLDAYDDAMFGELERWGFLRAFIWDVMLKGATAEEVAKRAKEISTPSSGSVRVHNDSEEWKAESPQLGSYEAANNARLFRCHILSGATIPEHWFGGGGDVNRATASEMGEPTFKVFSQRQRYIGYALSMVGTFQIRMRLKALYGATLEQSNHPEDYEVRAVFPELTARDTSKYATALLQVVSATTVAVERGLLSEETAIEMIALLATQLGVEVDAAEEMARAKVDRDKRKEKDGVPDIPEDPAPDPAQQEPAAKAA